MKETYVVCEERNTIAAFRHFFGPGYPGLHQVVRLALPHRVTTGIKRDSNPRYAVNVYTLSKRAP
jgi:hypothetical protein